MKASFLRKRKMAKVALILDGELAGLEPQLTSDLTGDFCIRPDRVADDRETVLGVIRQRRRLDVFQTLRRRGLIEDHRAIQRWYVSGKHAYCAV